MIKGSIQEEKKNIYIYIYTPSIGSSKYIKKTLADKKEETDSKTILVAGFNNPLTSVDRSYRQKIIKETLALNNKLNKMA